MKMNRLFIRFSDHERFWRKVNTDGPIPIHRPELGKCWQWEAGKTKRGYGLFYLDGTMRYAHRISYEMHIGNIPKNLELDHLCRFHGCLNPNHLEVVTHAENVRRGSAGVVNAEKQLGRTHCRNGHEYSDDNLRYMGNGYRQCKTCRDISAIDYRKRNNGK